MDCGCLAFTEGFEVLHTYEEVDAAYIFCMVRGVGFGFYFVFKFVLEFAAWLRVRLGLFPELCFP